MGSNRPSEVLRHTYWQPLRGLKNTEIAAVGPGKRLASVQTASGYRAVPLVIEDTRFWDLSILYFFRIPQRLTSRGDHGDHGDRRGAAAVVEADPGR